MRKRVMFQKGICSLLALLLAFSSLMALPVLAAAENEEPAAAAEPDPAPEEKDETPDETTPEEPVKPEKVKPEETDKPSEETSSVETAAPAEETSPEETDKPAEETGSEETATPAEETGSEEVTDPDKADEPLDETGETEGLENADTPESEELPVDEEEIEEEEELEEELIEAIAKLQAMPMLFSLRDRGPIYIHNDTLVLRTSASYYLQAHLVFSCDPSKDFILEVSSPQQYRFLCNWAEIHDSRVSVEVTPPMDNFTATLYLSLDFLASRGITLDGEGSVTFNNQSYKLSDLDLPGEVEKEKEPPKEEDLPPYDGITIDGNFDDWASIAKKDLRNPNPTWPCTMQSAVVWDGDYVYIYFHVDDGNASAIGAMGTHTNGQFGITTDLGNIRLVQADFGNNSVEIFGIDDALVAVDNYNWDPANGHSTEIAVPTSRLPAYKSSISFGYYQVEPFLKDIQNLNPVQGEIEESSDFACDGQFGEWAFYPHTLIEYDTAGQQDSKVDGGAALHVDNGILYGHVKTAHVDHLAENGSEFLAAIEIAFNGDLAYKDLPEKGNFYPKLLTEDGRVANEGTNNPNGISTYQISDIRRVGPLFGTMMISVTGTVDEMEFAIDLAKVADYIGCDESNFKTIHAKFGRIGNEWVTTGGTPTGPVLGLALCFSTVGGVYAVDRRKKKKK